MQMPEITRTANGAINWTPDLLDWLQAEISAGVRITDIAARIGCSPQRIHSCCTQYNITKPVRITEPPEARADFAALMAGRRFEDMPLRRTGRRAAGQAPVGPITRIIPRRPVGRALDLGGV